MSRKFRTTKSSDGKRKFLQGFAQLEVTINYDDVDHKEVDNELKALMQFLNDNWKPVAQ
jgi:hypothetical protein